MNSESVDNHLSIVLKHAKLSEIEIGLIFSQYAACLPNFLMLTCCGLFSVS